MTKVKICGITNLEDAFISVKFGADALGFNFYEKSPRYIAPEKAREICAELPPEILRVGVFVNEDLDKTIRIAEFVSLNAIQLHGDETPEFVRRIKERFSGETIKALRVSESFQPEDVLQFNADAILLDAFSKHEYGGTGETFNWEIAKKVQELFPKMYLAGGLSKENVANAVLNVRPFAVDSCSQLEKEKGLKDSQKVKEFILAVK
jgi:phosphoribosylanthranilate isomerase